MLPVARRGDYRTPQVPQLLLSFLNATIRAKSAELTRIARPFARFLRVLGHPPQSLITPLPSVAQTSLYEYGDG